MYEKKFAVMLTDTQEIKTLECDPQEELFEIARGTIGCEWIELVEAEPLAKKGYLMHCCGTIRWLSTISSTAIGQGS